ncbi:alpha/beta fold hydrolase [Notoacmeibacter ruber]|uniref:Alpha/beta hydrolase n=1 Tax=Notoacmeibacter ruber TaxID=2670375 RepID=A0A3L7JBH2_9HYPH|nr:alpha/beta hydrolase [Notoacmeibacter ruber]RLQ87735.1 alpha/beta hydrolase [Notoacmeibacter ruber]
MNKRTVEAIGADDNPLFGDAIGEGPPVLLLHGGGQTRYAWEKTASHLAENGYRAFTFDMRGHGDSAWVTKAGYSFHDYARDAAVLADWLTEETGRMPIGVGASLGGLSMIGAEDEQHRFAAIALVDIVPRMRQDGAQRIISFMTAAAEEGFPDLEAAADAISAYMPHRSKPKSLGGLRKNMRQHDDGRWRWHWDPVFASGGERSIMAEAPKHLLRFDEAIERLQLPVLLVRGMSSELVGEEEARDAASRLPNGRYVDIEQAGHMIVGDRNDAFTEALLSFLGDVQP